MLAVCLTIALFTLWLLTGHAVLALFASDRSPLESMLLAPVVGLAVVVLCVFQVSRVGVPLKVAALPLVVVVLLAVVALLWRVRPSLPLKSYAPFGLVLLVSLLVSGRPMLEFGFDWLSYSNDDMANYTLGAQRMVTHGFFDIPASDELVTGRDYSLVYWFFNLRVRPGSELLTAWVSALTHLSPHQVFMPLIMALYLVLISTAGAMAVQGTQRRAGAIITCCLLGLSAMSTLGVLYQLIAQIGGLALLIGCSAVLLRPLAGLGRNALLRRGVEIGVLGGALFVVYPEVVPFLGLSWLLYLTLVFVRRREGFGALLPALGVAVVIGVVLLNSYALISLDFLLNQASSGVSHADLETVIFPYFLLPSGLATLWGFQSLDKLSGEPWLSTSIVLGALLVVTSIVAALRGSWRLQPAAIVTVVMTMLGMDLFLQRADFGLFKLAMYVQPFVIPTLVTAWLGIFPRRIIQVAPLLVLGALGLYVQTGYVDRSRGILGATGGGLTEVPNASAARINTEFQKLLAALGPGGTLVLDTSNVVLAKFQALYLIGRPSAFAAQDFFFYLANTDPGIQLFNPNIRSAARELQLARSQRFSSLSFDMLDASQPALLNAFVVDTGGQPPQTDPAQITLIETSGKQGILNRWAESGAVEGDFVARPWNEVSNHLLFIASQLGQPYYTSDRHHISLYQLEPDYFFAGASMSGLGRHFLFQVVNPTAAFRVVMDVTTSLAGDGINQLPPASVIGAKRQPLPFVGHGSARVFSPPVTPQIIDGRAYVSIDMGSDGRQFARDRTGLMNWYGLDVPLDRRWLIGFVRDISVISESDYANVTPPSVLDVFPGALHNPQLEYSGVYEDGWVSDAAYFVLSQPESARSFAVRGTLPTSDASKSTNVAISVDGQQVLQQALPPGDFNVAVPVTAEAGRHRVELRFDKLVRLGTPDNRPAAALLSFVGFQTSPVPSRALETPAAHADVVAPSSGLVLGDGWYPFETWAGQWFRWVNNDAELVLDRPQGGTCTLRVDVEPGPGVGSRPFTLKLYDSAGSVLSSAQVAGRQTIQLATLDSPSAKTVRLHVDDGGLPAAGDPRTLNFRVFELGCADDAAP